MPDDDLLLQGGKVIAGAAIFITFLTLLSMMMPISYPLMEDQDVEEPSTAEKIRDFLLSFPYNFCIGGVLIIVSIFGSYYSKIPAVAGDVLRSLSPFQGYIFGFGAMLIFSGFL
ncbi:hypothetical protein ES703_105254 [subsurface metagenome]